LKENYELEGMMFSVNNQDIILSTFVYDQYLTYETGLETYKKFFAVADKYDNILIDQYGALKRATEDNS
jgi:serine protease Do